ncbi:hypothetical protein [Geoalkalibacter halelectricus]|uniref:Uncharacterized protein n=1 Tax=Geoalkalibacter halelectricus TaxID=2847045 RepID=A0ABY5ZTI3_9BACT|nr:hypothetical protein [Geoalkalibacter halelectricus]MDO3379216.1 hypothetical protein [Geoalkalibacter halelectricus]UWZ80974.1 hypothetical protein L9S41_06160 [Geoalkalibacter halelectricus]
MKFSRDHLLLLLLAVCLLAAMLITLFVGGSRSRHGYGQLDPPVPRGIQAGPLNATAKRSFSVPVPHHHRTKGVTTNLKS